jgi:hypothetical protein
VSSKNTSYSPGNRHVLVLWTEENQCSVTSESFVTDTRMLTDSNRVGLVEYRDAKKKAPPGSWKKFPAQVLFVSGEY